MTEHRETLAGDANPAPTCAAREGLRLRAVSKSYREAGLPRPVLSDVDLQVGAGEVVALLGRSGAGKSTLLNLISGIEPPDTGEIRMADVRLSALAEPDRTLWRRRNLGMVFQFFNLIPTLTVAENALLPLALNGFASPSSGWARRLRGRPQGSPNGAKQAAESDVFALLERVGLGSRHDAFPERLSGGEQQRLAVVRALAHRPALVLADEPTGNLDSETGDAIVDLLLELAGQRDATVIIVTHSEAIASRTERVFNLASGKLRERAL